MTQITFRDCAVPLSILFMCVSINVALLENFQTNVPMNAYMSADKDETQGYTKMKKGFGGNWDRSNAAKKYEKKKTLSDLKVVGLFDNTNENQDDNTDLTNWASFDPLIGLNSNISVDAGSSFAQITNHLT